VSALSKGIGRKIRDIETIPVFGGGRDCVFVRVHTDEGVTGTGEGTLEGRARTIVAAVEESSASGRSCTGTPLISVDR
jgi:L-alanine-DL-glutamate epimerase-like enolase superfamily enzyme